MSKAKTAIRSDKAILKRVNKLMDKAGANLTKALAERPSVGNDMIVKSLERHITELSHLIVEMLPRNPVGGDMPRKTNEHLDGAANS